MEGAERTARSRTCHSRASCTEFQSNLTVGRVLFRAEIQIRSLNFKLFDLLYFSAESSNAVVLPLLLKGAVFIY